MMRWKSQSLFLLLLSAAPMLSADQPLPVLNLPDPKIAEVYRGNWLNALQPCIEPLSSVTTPKDRDSEPQRPWRVDVKGHYPGWYPGVDVKHSAAAYLACRKDLPLVLRAWDLTVSRYQRPDGAVHAMTMNGNPHEVVPETTIQGNVVYYPLRLTGAIDFLLLGDIIFRFSQDQAWLQQNLPVMARTAAHIEGWMDDEGLLHSDSYDLDQVYREIDGVALAAAFNAFRRLAALESVAGTPERQQHYDAVAVRLAGAANKHFFDPQRGYYMEHLIYNNIAQANRMGAAVSASSELDGDHAAAKAIDGILGRGMDAFGAGIGAAGQNEWATKGETAGAWLQVSLKQPERIGKVILLNRTDPNTEPGERFAAGRLEFSDGSDPVEVLFNSLEISRAVASFTPREVAWVKFTGTRMQGEGGANAGLAEFQILPAEEPYTKVTHGMTDTNYAMLAFGAADETHAGSVWDYFRKHEAAFYQVGDLNAPTWIAEDTPSYSDAELNRRAPRKDCVAMARIWRYDALMRQRMDDGDGLYRTVTYANALYDRPSGGGAGLFAERYGLGRFQPGDESQANVPAYAEYPAVYNSTIVQQTLLGLDVDVHGTIAIAPCVPAAWYAQGFGAEGCGLLNTRDLGFTYHADRVEGWVSGAEGTQTLRVRLPRGVDPAACTAIVEAKTVPHLVESGAVRFDVPVKGLGKTGFRVL
ncbi:MAG: discoidin domain-containing protein [Candidatus Hydrogenedentes bacterium]|nr:discoidin domain-containing protein [Candidatus Hydrogenedentota bacterium]